MGGGQRDEIIPIAYLIGISSCPITSAICGDRHYQTDTKKENSNEEISKNRSIIAKKVQSSNDVSHVGGVHELVLLPDHGYALPSFSYSNTVNTPQNEKTHLFIPQNA